MNTNVKSTYVLSNQTTENGAFDGREHTDLRQAKASALHVQTSIQAGGFISDFLAWFDGFNNGYNQADASSQPG